MRFDHLAHTACSDGMAVAHETSPGIDRQVGNFRVRTSECQLRTHRGQGCRAAFQQFHPLARPRESKDFIRHDFGDRKTIVHLGGLNIARLQSGLAVGLFGGAARDGEIGCILPFQGEAIGRVTIAEQTHGSRPGKPAQKMS